MEDWKSFNEMCFLTPPTFVGECPHVQAFRKDPDDHQDLWRIRILHEGGCTADLKACDACARKPLAPGGTVIARAHFGLITEETAVRRFLDPKLKVVALSPWAKRCKRIAMRRRRREQLRREQVGR
jgi:hypothetical protein